MKRQIPMRLLVAPSAIVLDVRGTMLHPYDDEPISVGLLAALDQCWAQGLSLALVTGCSRETIEELILRPWTALRTSMASSLAVHSKSGALYLYTATGAEAYSVTPALTLQALGDYEQRQFQAGFGAQVRDVLHRIDQSGRWNARIEERNGQFNFYVGAGRKQRKTIASAIKDELERSGMEDTHVIVPSRKDVIDVSLSSKARAAKDFLQRLEARTSARLKAPVWVVSDSLQHDGADVELLQSFKRVVGVHIGEQDAPLHRHAVALPGGPQATQAVLSCALTLLTIMTLR